MPQRVEERVRPITPQLAWRVAVLGGIAFVLFGIVFFRLWYLQVLTGDTSRVAASQNGRRTRGGGAPRGEPERPADRADRGAARGRRRRPQRQARADQEGRGRPARAVAAAAE